MCPEYLGSLRQTLLQSTALGTVLPQPFRGATSLRVPLWPGLASSPLATNSVIYYRAGMGRLDGGPGRAHVHPRPLTMVPPAHHSSGHPCHPSSFWQPVTSHASFCLQLFFLGYLLLSTKQSVNNFHVKGKVKIISVNFMAIFVIAVWKLGVGIQQYCWLFPGCVAWHFVVTKEPVCASPLPLSLFLQGFFSHFEEKNTICKKITWSP